MSEENEPKIRVKDRRMFNLDGTPRTPDREETPAAREAERAPQSAAAPAPAGASRDNVVSLDARDRGGAPAEPQPKPAAEPSPMRPAEPSLFSELVHSLAYQAAMLMGLVRDPLGPQLPTDMRAARSRQ
jgi:hypothetical protein